MGTHGTDHSCACARPRTALFAPRLTLYWPTSCVDQAIPCTQPCYIRTKRALWATASAHKTTLADERTRAVHFACGYRCWVLLTRLPAKTPIQSLSCHAHRIVPFTPASVSLLPPPPLSAIRLSLLHTRSAQAPPPSPASISPSHHSCLAAVHVGPLGLQMALLLRLIAGVLE